MEVASQHVWRDRKRWVGRRRPDETAFSSSADARRAHQPFHAMKSDETAAKPQLGMHTRASVRPAALLVNGRDVDRQLPVASAPSRLGALDPGVIAGTRNLEQTAHGSDRGGWLLRLLRLNPSKFH